MLDQIEHPETTSERILRISTERDYLSKVMTLSATLLGLSSLFFLAERSFINPNYLKFAVILITSLTSGRNLHHLGVLCGRITLPPTYCLHT